MLHTFAKKIIINFLLLLFCWKKIQKKKMKPNEPGRLWGGGGGGLAAGESLQSYTVTHARF